MKTGLTISLFISFIAIAVFGILVMNLEAADGHVSCIAQTVQGALCPESSGPFSFIDFHISAFKSFSTAVFGGNALALILTVLFLLALFALAPAAVSGSQPSFIAFHSQKSSEPILSKKPFIHWLALHENSPSFL
ncbi:MAG: hypothetical protein HYT13_03290 [Candidatus Liptonbacteria bacterium]|nr:hypothetical protein [Candidatus Liptonbacteria bacterium]